ncbi:Gfo/Idh/MocA family protein [Streptomyces sp. NPDC048612]|uniref:Gfo/Idh/MocA family protein n=1 Tax=Streptomyces sp. NPDC048612 TaxID=3365579 RepID=UPI0037180828
MRPHAVLMAGPVRMGVLGCADIASRRTLPALLETEGLELACVASRDAGRAAAFTERFGGEPLDSYEKLLMHEDVDAVYVCLPTLLHARWAERALAAGKHVLVEKPLAACTADADRLFAAARGANLVLRENFMFLHHRQHRRVAELLTSGVLGTVRTVSAAFTIPPRSAGDSRYDPELGGGALLDNGVYPLRAALRFLGTGLSVAGAVLRVDERYGVDVAGAALLAAADGTSAQVRFGMEHHYRSWYEIQGSAGTLAVDHVYTTAPPHRPVLRLSVGTEHSEITVEPEDHFTSMLTSFRDAVRGSELPLLEEESLAQARLLDEVRGRATRFTV